MHVIIDQTSNYFTHEEEEEREGPRNPRHPAPARPTDDPPRRAGPDARGPHDHDGGQGQGGHKGHPVRNPAEPGFGVVEGRDHDRAPYGARPVGRVGQNRGRRVGRGRVEDERWQRATTS